MLMPAITARKSLRRTAIANAAVPVASNDELD
jgi:hypothetical protein